MIEKMGAKWIPTEACSNPTARIETPPLFIEACPKKRDFWEYNDLDLSSGLVPI